MPKKRPHQKSRLGCDQCRKRRVKCDEKAPRCTNCTNRDEQCVFPLHRTQTANARNESETFSTSPASTELSTNCSVDSFTYPRRTPSPYESNLSTQVALMHYWCTKTCHTFTRNGSELFRDHVGKEALQHQYLMEAVFSVTLLHQASELDDLAAVRRLVGAALQYQNSSVLGLRKSLADLSPSNCDALFICSVLVMVSAIVSPLLPTSEIAPSQTTSDTIVVLVALMSGVNSVVDMARPWIEQGPLHRFFGIVEPRSTSLNEWGPASDLRDLVYAEVSHDYSKRQIFEDAITGLERVHNREICAVTWIMQIGTGLIENFREGDLIAMTIFMHWAVLLQTTDDMWWKQYAGSRLVQELSASLTWRGDDFERMSVWCRREVKMTRQSSCHLY